MARKSSLNPNAEPYTPPSRRGAEKDSKNDEKQNLVQFESENMAENEPSQVQDEIVVVVDIADVDIEYIKLGFPDILEDFIRDAYLANDSDLDDTIDMLYQLEFNVGTERQWRMFQHKLQQQVLLHHKQIIDELVLRQLSKYHAQHTK